MKYVVVSPCALSGRRHACVCRPSPGVRRQTLAPSGRRRGLLGLQAVRREPPWRPTRRSRAIGQNMTLVANVPLDPRGRARRRQRRGLRGSNAADIELAGDYAYIGSYAQGLVIANIASCDDPTQPAKCKPFVQSVLPVLGRAVRRAALPGRQDRGAGPRERLDREEVPPG